MRLPNIGDLNRRITAYSVSHAGGKSALLEQTDAILFRLWGMVEVVGGTTYFDSANINEAITHRIWVRYVPGLSRPQDLRHLVELESEGIRYRVRRVTDANGAHRFIAMECEELGDG